MGLLDLLLSESPPRDGGFLARLLDPQNAAALPVSGALDGGGQRISPLLSLLRSGPPSTTGARQAESGCQGCAAAKAAATAPMGNSDSASATPGAASAIDATSPGASADRPIKVATPEEAARLPMGSWYEAPDGRVLQRRPPGARA